MVKKCYFRFFCIINNKQNRIQFIMTFCLWSIYEVTYKLYFIHCTSYTVLHILYFIHCTLYTVLHILYFIYCTSYTVLHILYFIYCTSYTVLHTLYFIHCTSYTVLHIILRCAALCHLKFYIYLSIEYSPAYMSLVNVSIGTICVCMCIYLLVHLELGLLTGVAAILRFPLPELDQEEEEQDNSD